MPGLHKMNNAGIQFLCKLYKENPNMSFKKMLPVYNDEAKRQGWRCIRSSWTISYHLIALGIHVRDTRDPKPVPRKGLEIIELETEARKKIMETFSISGPSLSLTLRRKRNGKNADAIRKMALELGGKLFVRAGVEVKPTKVLDSKGNVTGVIINK